MFGNEEEIDIFLKYKEEGGREVTDQALDRIDRISDALGRMRRQAEETTIRLEAMRALGLFNMPSGPVEGAGGTGGPIRLGPGPGQENFDTMLARATADAERLLALERGIDNERLQGLSLANAETEKMKATLSDLDYHMSGLAELDRHMSGEVENQSNWWQKIKGFVGDIRSAGTSSGEAEGQAQGWHRLGAILNEVWRLGDGIGDQLGRALRWITEGIGDIVKSGKDIPVIGAALGKLGPAIEQMGVAGVTSLPVLIALVGGTIAAVLGLAGAILSLVAVIAIFSSVILAAVAILATFLAAGAATILLVGSLLAIFAGLAGAIVFWGVALQGGAGAAAALTTATTHLKTAQEGLDASQLALSKWWANHPFGPQNQSDVLTLQGLMDRLRDSQDKLRLAHTAYTEAVANSQSPLQRLGTFLDENIAAKLEPLAIKISNFALTWAYAFAQTIAPAVVDAGTRIMNWVGDRLPGALSALQTVVTDLMPVFTTFAEFMGHLFDRNVGPAVGPAIEAGVKAALGAVTGLLTNLERLSNWFQEKLPDGQTRWQAYGAIVGAILSFAGSSVQSFANTWGRFADWLVANWPAITKLVSETIDSITKAWNDMKPVIDWFVQNVWPVLKDAMIDLAKHSEAWLGLIVFLVGAFIILVTILAAVSDGAVRLLYWLRDLFGWVGNFIDRLNNIANAVGNPFRFIQEWTSNLKSSLEDVWDMIEKIAGRPDDDARVAQVTGTTSGGNFSTAAHDRGRSVPGDGASFPFVGRPPVTGDTTSFPPLGRAPATGPDALSGSTPPAATGGFAGALSGMVGVTAQMLGLVGLIGTAMAGVSWTMLGWVGTIGTAMSNVSWTMLGWVGTIGTAMGNVSWSLLGMIGSIGTAMAGVSWTIVSAMAGVSWSILSSTLGWIGGVVNALNTMSAGASAAFWRLAGEAGNAVAGITNAIVNGAVNWGSGIAVGLARASEQGVAIIMGMVGGIAVALINGTKLVVNAFLAWGDSLVHSFTKAIDQLPGIAARAAAGWADMVIASFIRVITWIDGMVTKIPGINLAFDKLGGDPFKYIIDSARRASTETDRLLGLIGRVGKTAEISGAVGGANALAALGNLPQANTGLLVPGPIGSPQLIVAHGGEEIRRMGGDSISNRNLTVNNTFHQATGNPQETANAITRSVRQMTAV